MTERSARTRLTSLHSRFEYANTIKHIGVTDQAHRQDPVELAEHLCASCTGTIAEVFWEGFFERDEHDEAGT
jgi:hypothetical protein